MMNMKRILKGVILLLLVVSSLGKAQVVHAISPLEAIEEHKRDIIASARRTGVWPSVTAGQLILESGNPMSDLATVDNNFFGIKWSDSFADKYPGAYPVSYSTQECYDGVTVTIVADFAHFPRPADGITEHSIIWWNGCYQPELDILYDLDSTMDEFLQEMGNGPYATAENYYQSVRDVIDSFDLEELDKIAYPDGRKFCGYDGNYVGTYSYPNDGYNYDDSGNIGSITKNPNTGEEYVTISEEELVGMFPETFLLEGAKALSLPGRGSLSNKERVNLVSIKEAIALKYEWGIWDVIRVVIVFIGLCLLLYATFFGVAYIFDRTNNVIEISMISILSLGVLSYSDSDDDDGWRRVNMKGLFRIEAALILVGLFLVGGGLANLITDILYRIG